MTLAIIKYNAGNIQSVLNALERLGVNAEVTDDPGKIRSADKVIFPGVGEASSAMRSLKENNLHNIIKDLQQPVLGICVGMQLLCEHSEENDTKCLGIVPVQVRKFDPRLKLKVPQVGWNNILHCNHSFSKIFLTRATYTMCIAIMPKTVNTRLQNVSTDCLMLQLLKRIIFTASSFTRKKVLKWEMRSLKIFWNYNES